MNISEVKVRLSEEDVMSLLKELIALKGLIIESVEIDKEIRVLGSYKKIFNIKFSVGFNIIDVKGQSIIIKFTELKTFGIPAVGFVRKLILKKLLVDFKKIGITSEKDTVIINLKELIKDIRFLKLEVINLVKEKNNLIITLHNINISIKELISKDKNDSSSNENEVSTINTEKSHQLLEENVSKNTQLKEKINDYYTEGRGYIEKKIPNGLKSIEDYVLLVPDILALIVRLLKDNRVNKNTKIAVAASIGYIVVPKDVFWDKIPIVGSIDDMAVVIFALNKLINDVPIEILLENWQGNNNNVIVLKNSLDYIKKFTKAGKLDNFYSVIEGLI